MFFTLNLSPLGKKNANSAIAKFAQLHLDELPTSKPANKQETFKKINERFHLNALKRDISICSDWLVTLSILWLKLYRLLELFEMEMMDCISGLLRGVLFA